MSTKYVIINDGHGGLKRQAGATPRSLAAYNSIQTGVLVKALQHAEREDRIVIYLGDIFDGGEISYDAFAATYAALTCFAGEVWLVAGNHDLTKNRERISAFDLLCKTLPRAKRIVEPTACAGGFRIIPHLVNQAAFDEAIAEAPGGTLLCHCNYNNFFATEKDHSLNLTPEQAEKFDHVIIGHEHMKRDLPGVDILGSPLPCNIGECGADHGYHLWDGPGHDIEFVKTWDKSDYAEIDWRTLLEPQTHARFIRITGTATAEEAATVIEEVAKYRAASEAFFVSNSIKVGEINLGDFEEISESNLSGFDPMGLLKEMLPKQYHAKLEALCR